MSVTAAEYGPVTVLTLKEELVGDFVDTFRHRASQAFGDSRFQIVLDCVSVDGIDSAGLEALVELQNQCEAELGAVKLCGLNATCLKLLEITRLARRFEVFDDLDSAVKSYS